MNKELENLFIDKFKKSPDSFTQLPRTASSRIYYRIKSGNTSAIGCFNPNLLENSAYLHISNALMKINIPVPEIYSHNLDNNIYLVEDVGDATLFSYKQHSQDFNKYYQLAIEDLLKMQFESVKNIDLDKCYPRREFDRQSIMWDLNYFKYCFLKPLNIDFDEQLLENDFNVFANSLTKIKMDTFLYRDFQSRNIMIYKNKNFYIDFQGGRKGPVYYDLAALLFDSKANLTEDFRNELLDQYFNNFKRLYPIKQKVFLEYFYKFAFIRLLQAFGAYGFRGIIEKKDHFIKSIPQAVNNLETIIPNIDSKEYSHLFEVIKKIPTTESIKKFLPSKLENDLTINVYSFSYKKQLPKDPTDNGGGFLFDCRALPNPGRLEHYKSLSGKDEEVISYLSSSPEVEMFLINAFELIDNSIFNYLDRGFKHLLVGFGCTGGQHRSVYCVEKLVSHLNEKFNLNINVHHKEESNWKK